MKVILKNKKIKKTIFFKSVNTSPLTYTDETFDIVKEDGTNFESYDPHTTIDDYHGLEWEISDIINLLKFLGIEYELQEDIQTVEEEKE